MTIVTLGFRLFFLLPKKQLEKGDKGLPGEIIVLVAVRMAAIFFMAHHPFQP